jgi:GR25 family glycosyltransferase involved in LPS biosynthesis
MTYCSRPLLFLPLFGFAVLLTLYTWQPYREPSSSDPARNFGPARSGEYLPWKQNSGDNLLDVQNRTLGFQEIRVVSLPARTDKRDAWAVTSSVTGFNYEIVDGVDSTTISDKALPYSMHREPKVVACWRAHMNVLQDIVKRGVASTLVFEDDADWSVSLKSQLVQFARGSRWLLNATSDHYPKPGNDSPYGPGWDFLWLGHCTGTPRLTDSRRFVIPHDPTVEPSTIRNEGQNPHTQLWNDASPPDLQTRIVTLFQDAICTAGYAISLKGAKKALYHMSMLPYDAPVDWGYSDMCRDRKSGFDCIAPIPSLIGVHRPAGDTSGYSDIETIDHHYEDAHSDRIVFSTRLNLDRLLQGQRVMKSSNRVAEATGIQEMDIDDIGVAVGHEEYIEIEED